MLHFITIILSSDPQFMSDLVKQMSIGPSSSQTQVGFVIFGDSAASKFYLNTYTTQADVVTAIEGMRYLSQDTNTQQGLIEMQDVQFTSGRGDRAGIRNIAIILTDGESKVKPERTIPEAERARAAGIDILSIGIGSNINEVELKGMSSEPQTKDLNYFVSSFEELSLISKMIVSEACGTVTAREYPIYVYLLYVQLCSFTFMNTFILLKK